VAILLNLVKLVLAYKRITEYCGW